MPNDNPGLRNKIDYIVNTPLSSRLEGRTRGVVQPVDEIMAIIQSERDQAVRACLERLDAELLALPFQDAVYRLDDIVIAFQNVLDQEKQRLEAKNE